MKTILVPVDFSDASSRTVDTAFSLIQDIHVRLVFLHVVASPSPSRDGEIMKKLAKLVGLARERGIVASSRLGRGSAVVQILAQAADVRADLIVMGSHDRESLHGSTVGSTARGVLAVAPCPLVIVPSEKARLESVRRSEELAAVSAI